MSGECPVSESAPVKGDFVTYVQPAETGTEVQAFRTATAALSAKEIIRWVHELTQARQYEAAMAVAEANYSRLSTEADFLTALRVVHTKTGSTSRALQISYDLAKLRKASPASLRIASGRLREISGWVPHIAGPVDPVPPVNQMRIMHLVKESRPFLSNGFVARSHANFVAELAAGLEPHVVTEPGFARLSAGKNFSAGMTLDAVPHHHLDLGDIDYSALPADRFLEIFADLAYQRLKVIRPAVIHASSGRRGYETALVGLALKRKTGLPLVYEVRSFFEGNWTGDIEREAAGEVFERRMAIEQMCMDEADIVLTLGESMRDELVSRGVPEEKISLIPNGVDTEKFLPADKSSELVKRFGLERTFTFGYVSNMDHYRESQETLVEALASARSRGLEATLLLVGSGPREAVIRKRAEELGVMKHVRIVGHVDHQDIADYYRLIDLFVVPRVPERAGKYVTPLKPFEAMACGVPLAVSDLPALREIVEETRGFTFPPQDAEAIATLVGRAIKNPQEFHDVAAAARSWVVSDRQWTQNGPRYATAFEKARSLRGKASAR